MKKKDFKDWFRDRGRLQLLSFFLACVAWFAIHSGQTVKQRRDFKVQYINLPADLILASKLPDTLQIQLTGPLNRIRSLDEEVTTYIVDLSDVSSGKKSFAVDLANLKLPFDVTASNPRPRSFDLDIERLVQKEVPVEVVLQGVPAEGFVIASISVSPNPVLVSGPASQVQNIVNIPLSLDIDGRREDLSTTMLLDLRSTGVNSVGSVLVEVDLSAINLQTELSNVKVVAVGTESRVSISPPAATLVLEGSEESIQRVDEIRIEVSVEGLERGRYRIRGELKSSDGLRLVSMKPESFIVEILD